MPRVVVVLGRVKEVVCFGEGAGANILARFAVSITLSSPLITVGSVHLCEQPAPCGLRGCKNRPAPFPGRMSYKATKPGLVSVLYLSMRYTVLLFIRAPFYVSLVLVAMCSVFRLFWLSYQYLPSDWLERLL